MSARAKKTAQQIVGLGGAFMPAQQQQNFFAPMFAKKWSGPFILPNLGGLTVWKLTGDSHVYARGTSAQIPGIKAIGPIAGVPMPLPAGWIGWWRGDPNGTSFGLVCAAPHNPIPNVWKCSTWGGTPYPPVPPVSY